MPTIRFSAAAMVVDFRESDNGELVDNREVLKTLDGLAYLDESFSDYLFNGTGRKALEEAGISGGTLRFEFHSASDCLIAVTEYVTSRILSEQEAAMLGDYTVGQWSDGIGSNFFQERMAVGLAPQALVSDLQMLRVEQAE